MDKKILSIIVPVYNVSRYLSGCIESILNQEFQDFELILVDDGSVDDSGKICDEYAGKDNRLHVIHQQNGGVTSARKAAVKAAKSEWICVVGGVPASIIKRKCSEEEAKEMNIIAWWDWPEDVIAERQKDFEMKT